MTRPHTPGGDRGETAELLVADHLAGGDGAPLAAVQDLDVVGLHALAQGDVFLDAGDVEGPGLAEVELDLSRSFGLRPGVQEVSSLPSSTLRSCPRGIAVAGGGERWHPVTKSVA